MDKEILDRVKSKVDDRNVIEFRSKSGKDKGPRSLSLNGSRKLFTPDFVALYKNKRDLFSIEKKILKTDLPNLIAKWILFALEARKHGGDFYLVVSEKNSDQCRQIIKSKQLSVQLITY